MRPAGVEHGCYLRGPDSLRHHCTIQYGCYLRGPDSLLHHCGSLGPRPQGILYVAVSVVVPCQVHEGVDVLVVVELLG